MGTRILALVIIVALCFGGYYYYEQQKTQKQLENGEVQCVGCDSPEQHARFLKENSGDTPDGNREHKNESARQSAADIAAADATAGTPGYNTVNRATPGGNGPVMANSNTPMAGNQNYAPVQPIMTSTPAQTPVQSSMQSGVTMPPPAVDSQGANNANGMRYGGSGNYQWYRQGSLTYRVDTVTGRSCVAYATMEEWRKQVVISHGCGRAG